MGGELKDGEIAKSVLNLHLLSDSPGLSVAEVAQFSQQPCSKKKNVDKERRKLHKGQKTELGNKLRPWRCSLYATDEIGCAGEECFLSVSRLCG
ncbi:hypothetical protein NQZ68_040423 [Dissostichus eleginoides]|nr:hypothetical protein NQZ68_040423 [Dissostichus eleginoides]